MNDQSEVQEVNEAKIRADYRELTRLLIRRGLSVTTMESLTSGQIASLITDTEGASAIFRGADITYCNQVKVERGVPEEVIDTYSVYSRETADAMAGACAKRYGADIGIGVTGTTGNPDPANPEASVPGEVYFSIFFQGEIHSFQKKLGPLPSRFVYKLAVAHQVWLELWKLLLEK